MCRLGTTLDFATGARKLQTCSLVLDLTRTSELVGRLEVWEE